MLFQVSTGIHIEPPAITAVIVGAKPIAAIINIVMLADGQQTRANVRDSVGLDLVRRLKDLRHDLGIVLLSAYRDRGKEVLAMLRDMRGLVYRVRALHDPDELTEALHMAVSGGVWLDPVVDLIGVTDPVERILKLCASEERRQIVKGLNRVALLTSAERDVMTSFGQSWTTRGIAQELGIAPGTVESHINRIYTKLFGSDPDPRLPRSVLLAKIALIRQLQE